MFAVTNVFANSNEYELTDVKEEYIGTYIPVDLELRLYQSKKFYESLRAARKYGAPQPHDVLYLQKNICYSDVGFHDGYAIKNEEFASYKFITGKGGIFCIDDNGYLYRKISDADYGYTEYVEYVMKIILSNCSKSSEIKIEGQSIYIDNKKYEVNLDGAFFDIRMLRYGYLQMGTMYWKRTALTVNYIQERDIKIKLGLQKMCWLAVFLDCLN